MRVGRYNLRIFPASEGHPWLKTLLFLPWQILALAIYYCVFRYGYDVYEWIF